MKQLWVETGILTLEQLNLIQKNYTAPATDSSKIATTFGEQWVIYSMYALKGILPQEHYRC